MTNPTRLAREVEARHELRHPHDEVLREIETATPIDPDLDGIELTAAEVAAMTDAGEAMAEATWPAHTFGNTVPDSALAGSQYAPRRYRRRTHAEVEAVGYQQGWAKRDKLAVEQAEMWMQQREQVEFRVRVAFITGYVGGLVCMAALWLLL